jgi:hypothetical protein
MMEKDKDAFVNYLNVTTTVLNTETGPEPVQYVQNRGVWGFRCLMGGLDNQVWRFYIWNEKEKRYTESEFAE